MLVRILEFYGAGWMVAFAIMLVHLYRKNVAGEMLADVERKVGEEPDLREHYEGNIHGSRTKIRVFISLSIIAISFACASLWPLVVGVRLYSLGRRDD